MSDSSCKTELSKVDCLSCLPRWYIYMPKYSKEVFAKRWCDSHSCQWQTEEFANETRMVGCKSKQIKFWSIWNTCWQAENLPCSLVAKFNSGMSFLTGKQIKDMLSRCVWS